MAPHCSRSPARSPPGGLDLTAGADPVATERALLAIPGIGPWTASYVALRALGDRDAFPVGDLGLRRAANALGLPDDPAGLAAHAERWRPWRACAAHLLWAARINRLSSVANTTRERPMSTDIDPQETREWLDALEDVMRRAGPERAAAAPRPVVQEARLGAPPSR